MQCIILAGGLGTRIRAVNATVPKSLVPVRGVPFIDYQLSWLARQGIHDVVLTIGYLGEKIIEHVGDGSRWNLRVRYSDEGSALQGTGGAIRQALAQDLLEEAFFILYGDSFLPIAFAPVWAASGSGHHPTLTVFRNEEKWDRSNTIFADGKIVLYQKGRSDAAAIGMRHIDYGLSVLPRELIRNLVAPQGPADLADTYHRLSVQQRLRGFEVQERFYEIGSPDGLRDFEDYASQVDLLSAR
jgi:N-acetyl-alpha-D-muramate 1-phosphate uridylyltransferase